MVRTKNLYLIKAIRENKLHYQNLKLHSNLGLQLKKINFILEFKQEQLLKPYIKRDIDLKREAEKEGNGIKKENAKLRNSAIFGKSIECPTKKVDVKFVTTRKQFLK